MLLLCYFIYIILNSHKVNTIYKFTLQKKHKQITFFQTKIPRSRIPFITRKYLVTRQVNARRTLKSTLTQIGPSTINCRRYSGHQAMNFCIAYTRKGTHSAARYSNVKAMTSDQEWCVDAGRRANAIELRARYVTRYRGVSAQDVWSAPDLGRMRDEL